MTADTEITAAGPSYHRRAFDPATSQQIVAWAVEKIREHGIQAVAATGLSGLVIAGAIGHAAGIPVFAVRKHGDPSHSSEKASGVAPHGPVERWVFVDDLIESGATLRRVRDALYETNLAARRTPSLILLYGDWNSSGHQDVGDIQVPQYVFGKEA
jgi:adenine/guanine phosphoribosyltransferase-like PRPP-binding protein